MISLREFRWTILICVLSIAVGVLHGMTHVEFSERYTLFFDDIDKLCELFLKYVAQLLVKLGYDKNSDELKSMTNHYNQMVDKAQPLFVLYSSDLEKLIPFVDNLESIKMIKKFLYSYFRQSAINLIDHLKVVYNLD